MPTWSGFEGFVQKHPDGFWFMISCLTALLIPHSSQVIPMVNKRYSIGRLDLRLHKAPQEGYFISMKNADCIIHCDVKPANILLDSNFTPKLADFGLAKLVGRDLSRVLTTTRGTRGYLAPEWISGLRITAKVDVYTFGMTLLEIISGRRNLELNVQDSSQYYFPSWAACQIYGGNTISIVEKGIGEDGDIEEVRRASIVAFLCIENDEEVRPNMRQVVLMLEGKMQPRISQIRCPTVMNKKEDQSDTSSCSDS